MNDTAERIVNAFDALSNRFHNLGDQADRDRHSLRLRYETLKAEGVDFTSAHRQARIEFVEAVIAGHAT